MPNQDTRETRTFDYMEDSGVKRTCRATESHVSFPGQHDSQWEVKKPENTTWDGPYDWLTYMPPDGVQAHIKFHMESGGGTWGMNVWLENERLSGEHNQNVSAFQIYDWDGSVWKVSIPSEVRQNPWTPTFDLSRVAQPAPSPPAPRQSQPTPTQTPGKPGAGQNGPKHG